MRLEIGYLTMDKTTTTGTTEPDVVKTDVAEAVTNIPSPRLLRAMEVAARAHDGHYRKGTQTPYVSHVFGVMHIASTARWERTGFGVDVDAGMQQPSEDCLIACLFHDIFEDVPDSYPKQCMREEFGDYVVELVQAVTKDESLPSWRDRGEAYLEALRNTPHDEAFIVACADKLHNITAILADETEIGQTFWDRFNVGLAGQQWWYESMCDIIGQRLPDLNLLEALQERVKLLSAIEYE
ncbi:MULTISPECIES: HD domain-containing protein [unclassified Corynebacterium]|uniref:HD domain-containing protein n=1 Tax=unclassified Corynebacterium TaxID=2624378 RepID=UPI0030A69395